ncbi:MAG: hypothetical protein F2667_04720 [Actinobacteria bacterium]|uniref:Unannotated protein n=1 Tax=freshwater metagenome TaxID=449393 RepID=A0A6J6PTN8_9ZZZZ|nr:hypothetical protein [Actinomycetota bacterium]
MSVLSLTYVSSATALFTEADLVEMLVSIRPRNEAAGVSGMLLYRDGNIIQTLEGPQAAVQSTFDAIRRDTRHSGLLVLLERPIAERAFPQWSMGFRAVSDQEISEIEGYDRFLERNDAAPASADPARQLLHLFRQHMR